MPCMENYVRKRYANEKPLLSPSVMVNRLIPSVVQSVTFVSEFSNVDLFSEGVMRREHPQAFV